MDQEISVHKHGAPELIHGKKVTAMKKLDYLREREQDAWRLLQNVLGYHHADATQLISLCNTGENIKRIESQLSLLQNCLQHNKFNEHALYVFILTGILKILRIFN